MKAHLRLTVTALVGAAVDIQCQSVVQFSAATYHVTEGTPEVAIAIQRTNDFDTIVSVDFMTTTGGTATTGADFVETAATLTFQGGETNKMITVPILNDGSVEPIETFQLTLTNATGGAVLGIRATATVRITDNDKGLAWEFSSYRANENEPYVLVGVTRGDDGTFPISVDVATSDSTAVAGQDYAGLTNTLSFAPGERLKLIPIPILHDGLRESSEAFRVTLRNPTNQVLGSPRSALVTIVDNDAGVQFQPAYRLQNDVGTQSQPVCKYRVVENQGDISLMVVRGNDLNLAPFAVDYATSNLTATAGVDYWPAHGTLNFAQGEMSKTLTVPIVYDELREADEQFMVTLSNPTGGTALGPYATATVEILDITNTPPHSFENLAVQSDRTVQLTLGGGVDGHFKDYFDLYPIEVSTNLLDWTPWVTLVRTNASTNALVFTDTQATNHAIRFYRMATNHLITPWPRPTGPFPVGLMHRLLTDPSRRNRHWLSTDCSFMVSIWYPAATEAGKLPGPFLDLQIAQDPNWMALFNGAVSDFTARMPYLKSHALPEAPCAGQPTPFPIALFSPGACVPRSCAALGAELASHGYVMVSADHYDVTRTVFPDGTLLQGDVNAGEEIKTDRARDLAFITDELERWNLNDPVFAGRLDVTRIAALGGSRGGGAAAQFAAADLRCKAFVALDAGENSAGISLQQPVLQMLRPDNSNATFYDGTTNHAVWLQISGSSHGMVAGNDWYWAFYPEDVANSREVGQTLHAYTLWFLNKYLKGSSDPLPALADYPRVINFRQK